MGKKGSSMCVNNKLIYHFRILFIPLCNEYVRGSLGRKTRLMKLNIWFSFLSSFYLQPLPPLPSVVQQPLAVSQQKTNDHFLSATVSTTTQTTSLSLIKPATSVASTTTPTGVVKPTPSIAVTQTQSIEREERALINLAQRSKPPSPGKRKDVKKHSQHKSKHSALDRIHR